MPYFPLFLNLDGKKILIVGGGKVACHKAQVMLPFSDSITLIAEKFLHRLQDKKLTYIEKQFEYSDILGFDIVIGGTDSKEVNGEIFKACREKGILVNIVDDAEKSDFIFPAIHKCGDLTAAFSTSGKCPFFASKVRDDFAAALPKNTDAVINELSDYRNSLKTENLSISEKRERLKKYYEQNY